MSQVWYSAVRAYAIACPDPEFLMMMKGTFRARFDARYKAILDAEWSSKHPNGLKITVLVYLLCGGI